MSRLWVLVGLFQLLVLLCAQFITQKLLYKFLSNGQNCPDHLAIDFKWFHNPLVVCSKKICTHKQGVGICWVVIAYGYLI
jgi:hypothetical protein